MGNPYMGVGRNLAYRKSVFMENNGYYHHLKITGGDDDLIVNRLADEENTAICISPESQTNSVPKQTWNEWYRQKKRHLSVGKYYKFSDKIRTSMFTFSIIFFWFAIIAQTILGFLMNVEWFYYIVITTVIIRWLFLTLVLHNIAKKLGLNASVWVYPFWELFYILYQVIVGFIALTSKKVSWK
jgi:hypothetical protein